MKTRKGGLKQTSLLLLVIIAVFLGTLVALFALPPEEVRSVSEDGFVSLRGVLANPESLSIIRRDDLVGPFTTITSPVYEFTFAVRVLPQPLELTIRPPEEWGAIETLQLYFFDERYGAWRPAPSVNDPERGLSAEVITPAKLWALGRAATFPDPTAKAAMLNEATAFPPEGAVGYHAFSAFARAQGDFVLLEHELDRGGCDGVFLSGADQTLGSIERTIGDAVYRVGVIWELNGGCKEEQILHSISS